MNRAILLLICDFLLLSLLQFVNFDDPQEVQVKGQGGSEAGEAFLARAEQDLVELMRMSLVESEGQSQQLQQQVEQLQQNLTRREETVSDLEQNLETEQQETRRLAEEQRRLQEEREALAAERARLAALAESRAKELEERETHVSQLQERVQKSEEWGQTSQRQLELLQEEFKNKQELLDKLLADRTIHEEERSKLEAERRQLEVRWQVAETEKAAVEQNLVRSREDLQRVQEEKERVQQTAAVLAEGVLTLGETSQEIREEIQDMKTLTASAVFSRFQNAQVTLSWTTERGGLFGTSVREQSLPSLLVSDGSQVVALLHLYQTPLDPQRYTRPPQSLFGKIRIGNDEREITRIEQSPIDPRVLMIPIPEDLAQRHKDKWIRLATDPLQHGSLVLVSREGEYYGEGELRVRPDAKGYLRLPSGLFTRLFGEFSPNRGDWVFNRHGALIGIMVNADHAVILDKISSGTPWIWGASFDRGQSENLLNSTQRTIQGLTSPLR